MIARPLAPALCFIATQLIGCIDPPEAVQVADAAGSVKARSDLKDPWGGAVQHGDQAMSPRTDPAPAALTPSGLRDPFARGEGAAAIDTPPGELRDPFSPAAAGSSEAPTELRDPFAPKPTPSGAGKKKPPSADAATPLGPAPGSTMAAAVGPPAGEPEDELDPEVREKKAREAERARREREREAEEAAAEQAAAEQAAEPAAR
ncbi:MAG: hypothetical protein IPK80_17965 [Nannocystis sp.]|nr:hypothetical protein [Nannocystis sp.]